MANTQYALHLKGFVGGADFDRNYVDYVLNQHMDKPVNVLIDSLGGSVATALSIASAFRNHADVSVHFVGMNASAATIASLGAKHISIDANAMYLVHKCSSAFFEWGSLNADQFASLIADIEKIKADLDKLDLNIARMYSAKCKKNASDLLELMARGGWLTSQEALDWGFVDEITDLPEEAAPKLTDAVASAMAAAGMPIPNIPIADKDKEGGLATPDFGGASAIVEQARESTRLAQNVSRFLAAIASLFSAKPAHQPEIVSNAQITIMSKDFHLLSAALGAEGIAVTDNVPSVSLDDLTTIEAALAERDRQILSERKRYEERLADLNAQVATLKQAPADSTTNVVDTNHNKQDETPLDAYYRRVNAAKEMFNALP